MPRWLQNFLFQAIVIATLTIVVAFFATRPEQDHKHDRECDYAELCADQKAKGEFFGLSPEGWTAIFTGVLSIFTIGLCVATFKLWDSTDKLVLGAEETAERQLRAYVHAAKVRLFLYRPQYYSREQSEGAIQGFGIVMELENSGQTPTRKAVMSASGRVFNDEVPDDFDFPDADQIEIVTFGPGVMLLSPSVSFNRVNIEKYCKILVWGWVEYSDVFNNTPRRRTEFCFEIPIRVIQWSEEYIPEFVHFKRFNGADEDCLHKAKEYHERVK